MGRCDNHHLAPARRITMPPRPPQTRIRSFPPWPAPSPIGDPLSAGAANLSAPPKTLRRHLGDLRSKTHAPRACKSFKLHACLPVCSEASPPSTTPPYWHICLSHPLAAHRKHLSRLKPPRLILSNPYVIPGGNLHRRTKCHLDMRISQIPCLCQPKRPSA